MIVRDHSLSTRDTRPKPTRDGKSDRIGTRDLPDRPSIDALSAHYAALGIVGKQCNQRCRDRAATAADAAGGGRGTEA